MSRNVMSYLVAKHACELSFGVEVVHQATVDVHVPAAWRERIHLIVVENEEFEIPVGNRRLRGHFCADALDIILNRLVFVQTVELDDLEVYALGLLLFAFHRGEDDVMPPRCGVRGAGGGEDGSSGGDCYQGATHASHGL